MIHYDNTLLSIEKLRALLHNEDGGYLLLKALYYLENSTEFERGKPGNLKVGIGERINSVSGLVDSVFESKSLPMLLILIKLGVNFNTANKFGNTSLHLATKLGKLFTTHPQQQQRGWGK